MKKLLGGLVTAFSMYSAIPVPQVEWTSDSLKYALCFFPLVGAVIGGLCRLWIWACSQWALGAALCGAGIVLLPLVITGGIHLDGFLDTSDGIHSHQAPAKKLEILKDPHVGAFGVIRCGMYLIAQFALGAALYDRPLLAWLPCIGFVVSRGFSAISVVSIPTAKQSGLVWLFADAASKRAVQVTAGIFVLAGWAGMIWVNPLFGGISVVCCIGWFLWFRRICKREFGGITGDLAGYFVENLELLLLAAAVLGGFLL